MKICKFGRSSDDEVHGQTVCIPSSCYMSSFSCVTKEVASQQEAFLTLDFLCTRILTLSECEPIDRLESRLPASINALRHRLQTPDAKISVATSGMLVVDIFLSLPRKRPPELLNINIVRHILELTVTLWFSFRFG